MVTASQSLEQRRAALRRANEIRVFRSLEKKRLKAGEVSVHELLLAPPPEMVTMRVHELLLASPKVGRVKAQKLMRQTACASSQTLGRLSPRRRAELAALLPHYRPGRP